MTVSTSPESKIKISFGISNKYGHTLFHACVSIHRSLPINFQYFSVEEREISFLDKNKREMSMKLLK